MRIRISRRITAALLLMALGHSTAASDEGKYTLKTAEAAPPSELKAPIRDLLAQESVQVFDAKGELFCELWFRKCVPVQATEAQLKNGLSYRDLSETAILGAVRFAQDANDYREQQVAPGVYTLRLAFQPQDGDHMGTSPYPEFCLVVSAKVDAKPDLMDPFDLQDASAVTLGGNHPGVFMLFPNNKPDNKPEAEPKLSDQGMGHWVVHHTLPVDANGKPGKIGIALTVVGHSVSGH